MRTLHMLHTLDVEVGEFTATVRNGFKWADLKTFEQIELCVCYPTPCVCYPTPQDHLVVGVGEVTGLWFGRFKDIPARLIANEHEVMSRTYLGLRASMERAYGAGFSEDSPVTVVEYLRIK